MSTILRLPQVRQRTGLSKSSIYSFISSGNFPKPISLGVRAVGWEESSIDNWIQIKIDKSREVVAQYGH